MGTESQFGSLDLEEKSSRVRTKQKNCNFRDHWQKKPEEDQRGKVMGTALSPYESLMKPCCILAAVTFELSVGTNLRKTKPHYFA